MMRTTIDLPEDLHELARELAHRQRKSLSAVVADLMRRGLASPAITANGIPSITTHNRGLPVVSVGRPITAEDVAASENEAEDLR